MEGSVDAKEDEFRKKLEKYGNYRVKCKMSNHRSLFKRIENPYPSNMKTKAVYFNKESKIMR